MRGLLLKDLYMTKKYCRGYLLIVVVFIAVAFSSNDNLFFGLYPCLLSGLISVNLLGYDERSKWIGYSGTLPYTKAQIVSGKYLISLTAQISVLVLVGIAQAARMNMGGIFEWNGYLILMSTFLITSLLAVSVTLPCMFRWGVQKGRIAYYVMIGISFSMSYIVSEIFTGEFQVQIPNDIVLPMIYVTGIVIYVFSWYLSVVFYRRRENF